MKGDGRTLEAPNGRPASFRRELGVVVGRWLVLAADKFVVISFDIGGGF